MTVKKPSGGLFCVLGWIGSPCGKRGSAAPDHPACPRSASIIKPARGRNKRGDCIGPKLCYNSCTYNDVDTSFDETGETPMDITQRKITKIAREAEKLVLLSLREEGVGTAEIDLIHALRHNPGCTQAALAKLLHADKAAIARRTKKSGRKGLPHPAGRPQRPAQPAAVPHRKGREPEILQSRGGSGLLRVPDRCAHAGGSRRFCGCAEQAVHRVQNREPCWLPALPEHRRR